MDDARIKALETQAAELGRDAALAAATWVEMDRPTAVSLATDVDPEVLDRFRYPALSGEMADDPTPDTLYDALGLTESERVDLEEMLTDPFCDAWETAASETFSAELDRIAAETLTDDDHIDILADRAHAADLEARRASGAGPARAGELRREAREAHAAWQAMRDEVFAKRQASGAWPIGELPPRYDGRCPNWTSHHVGDMCLTCGNDER